MATPREILLFELGGRHYGLPAGDVQELVRAVALTPLPKAPAVIEGLINLRGRIVPVLDVRARFRHPPSSVKPSDHLIIARAGDRLVALRVDRALDLVRLEEGDMDEARGVVPGVEYVTWVVRRPGNLVLIHDLRTFLSRAEEASLDEALSAPAEKEGRTT
jgi:purine-binding chemotaxis protein CheW